MTVLARIIILLLVMQATGVSAWVGSFPDHTPMDMDGTSAHTVAGMHTQMDCCDSYTDGKLSCVLDCLFGRSVAPGVLPIAAETETSLSTVLHASLSQVSYTSIQSPPENPPPLV